MSTYAIIAITEDGPDIWDTDLTLEQAKAEVEKAKSEFGGKYRIELQPANPLDLIPDCRQWQ
jgi:hypothetical protein